jgi:hypothetical protein
MKSRTDKQLENDRKLSVKLKEYHAKIRRFKEAEEKIMHEVIEQLSPEEDNIVVSTEEKKKRGRPKGSFKKKKLITPLNDIQNSVDITS